MVAFKVRPICSSRANILGNICGVHWGTFAIVCCFVSECLRQTTQLQQSTLLAVEDGLPALGLVL